MMKSPAEGSQILVLGSRKKAKNIALLTRARELDAEAATLLRNSGVASACLRIKKQGQKGLVSLDNWSRCVEAAAAAREAGEGEIIGRAPALLREAADLRWRVVVSSEGLARRFAGYYRGAAQRDDVVQFARLGLWEAAKRFDPERKIAFSTYARWWVRAKIERELGSSGESGGQMRVPAHLAEKMRNIRKLDGREGITQEQIAEYLGLTLEEVQYARRMTQAVVSLDAPVGGEPDSMRLSEKVSGPEPEEVHGTADVEILMEALDLLPDREREILSMRYGLDETEPMNFAMIGGVVKLSRERIRQICAKAEVKLLGAIQEMRRKKREKFILSWSQKGKEVKTQASRGETLRRARMGADVSQGQLATKVAAITGKKPASMAASISNFERHGLGTDEFKGIVEDAMAAILRERADQLAAGEAVGGSREKKSQADAAAALSRAGVLQPPQTEPSTHRRSTRGVEPRIESGDLREEQSEPLVSAVVEAPAARIEEVAPSQHPGGGLAESAGPPDVTAPAVTTSDLIQLEPLGAARAGWSEEVSLPIVEVQREGPLSRLDALMTRCEVPQAPPGEDVAWRMGWLERTQETPPRDDYGPPPVDDLSRVESFLSRLGVPLAPAGESLGWRLGHLEGVISSGARQ